MELLSRSLSFELTVFLAVFGFPCLFFWCCVVCGMRKPSHKSKAISKTLFFKSSLYRYCFRQHRFVLVKVITFALAFLFPLILIKLFFNVVFDLSETLPGWSLIAVTALSMLLLISMGRQGLTVALDKRLSLSWDRNDSLAIHLTQRKIRRLTPGFVNSIAKSICSHHKLLQSLGIKNSLEIESWLLAPKANSGAHEINDLHRAIRLGWINAIYPTLGSKHIAWLLRSAIARRKRIRAKCISKCPARGVGFVRVIIFAQKCVAGGLAMFKLVFLSPLIFYRVKNVGAPAFSATYPLRNGTPSTARIMMLESYLNVPAPNFSVSVIPFERMSTLSIIVLVTQNPGVADKVGGWTTGVKLN